MSEAQSNGIDPTVAKRWVGDIKAKFDQLDSMRGSYMKACKGVRDQISEMKEAAQNAGIPRRGLNHLLKRHVLEGKLKSHEDDAEGEVVETADMIDDALGGDKGLAGSPLAAAAGGKGEANAATPEKAKRGRPSKKAAAPLVGEDNGEAPKTGADDEPDLRSTRQKDNEAARVAENEERLKGIKPLEDKTAVH